MTPSSRPDDFDSNDDQTTSASSIPVVGPEKDSSPLNRTWHKVSPLNVKAALKRLGTHLVPTLAVVATLLLAFLVVLQSLVLQRLQAIALPVKPPTWGDYRSLGSPALRQAFMDSLPIVRIDPRQEIPVSITDISTSGELSVSISDISTTDELPVTISNVSTTDELPVSINDIGIYGELPVTIKGISTTDELRVWLYSNDIPREAPIPVKIIQ